jgi:hypothetical protein
MLTYADVSQARAVYEQLLDTDEGQVYVAHVSIRQHTYTYAYVYSCWTQTRGRYT